MAPSAHWYLVVYRDHHPLKLLNVEQVKIVKSNIFNVWVNFVISASVNNKVGSEKARSMTMSWTWGLTTSKRLNFQKLVEKFGWFENFYTVDELSNGAPLVVRVVVSQIFDVLKIVRLKKV